MTTSRCITIEAGYIKPWVIKHRYKWKHSFVCLINCPENPNYLSSAIPTQPHPSEIKAEQQYAPAQVASKGSPGLAGLKNGQGKARGRRQYACTASPSNAAMAIFSGPRFRPALQVQQSLFCHSDTD